MAAAATTEKKPEGATEKKPVEAGGKKPSFLLIIIGVLVFLLVVAVGGFIGYTRLPRMVAAHQGAAPVEAETEEDEAPLRAKGLLALDPFLVNLADTDNPCFLKATFQLGLAHELKAGGEGESKGKGDVQTAAIRDTIISLLSSKTSDQLLSTPGKDKLRAEIKSRLNALGPENPVVDVYIVDFVVQV